MSASSTSLSSFSGLPGAVSHLPGVWHADELSGGQVHTVATGHPLLDAELPGGGWPLGALTELLQRPEAPSWSLLLPALAVHWHAFHECVALVCPPHEPFVPALAAAGLPGRAILWIRADTAASSLWSAEQALQCAGVGAVVAWLPGAQPAGLRRLQAAAARRAGALLFALRPESAATVASPARVRMIVRGVAAPSLQAGAEQVPQMQVQILKRRGPPMTRPLVLHAYGESVRVLLSAYASSRRKAKHPGAAVLPFALELPEGAVPSSHLYALDRVAVAA